MKQPTDPPRRIYYVYGSWNESDARVFHVAKIGDSTPIQTYRNLTTAENDAEARNNQAAQEG